MEKTGTNKISCSDFFLSLADRAEDALDVQTNLWMKWYRWQPFYRRAAS